MPEIGSSGLMSGDGKRGVGHRPQATAPILDSTGTELSPRRVSMELRVLACFNPQWPSLIFAVAYLSCVYLWTVFATPDMT
jgi:hypothetical protein